MEETPAEIGRRRRSSRILHKTDDQSNTSSKEGKDLKDTEIATNQHELLSSEIEFNESITVKKIVKNDRDSHQGTSKNGFNKCCCDNMKNNVAENDQNVHNPSNGRSSVSNKDSTINERAKNKNIIKQCSLSIAQAKASKHGTEKTSTDSVREMGHVGIPKAECKQYSSKVEKITNNDVQESFVLDSNKERTKNMIDESRGTSNFYFTRMSVTKSSNGGTKYKPEECEKLSCRKSTEIGAIITKQNKSMAENDTTDNKDCEKKDKRVSLKNKDSDAMEIVNSSFVEEKSFNKENKNPYQDEVELRDKKVTEVSFSSSKQKHVESVNVKTLTKAVKWQVPLESRTPRRHTEGNFMGPKQYKLNIPTILKHTETSKSIKHKRSAIKKRRTRSLLKTMIENDDAILSNSENVISNKLLVSVSEVKRSLRKNSSEEIQTKEMKTGKSILNDTKNTDEYKSLGSKKSDVTISERTFPDLVRASFGNKTKMIVPQPELLTVSKQNEDKFNKSPNFASEIMIEDGLENISNSLIRNGYTEERQISRGNKIGKSTYSLNTGFMTKKKLYTPEQTDVSFSKITLPESANKSLEKKNKDVVHQPNLIKTNENSKHSENKSISSSKTITINEVSEIEQSVTCSKPSKTRKMLGENKADPSSNDKETMAQHKSQDTAQFDATSFKSTYYNSVRKSLGEKKEQETVNGLKPSTIVNKEEGKNKATSNYASDILSAKLSKIQKPVSSVERVVTRRMSRLSNTNENSSADLNGSKIKVGKLYYTSVKRCLTTENNVSEVHLNENGIIHNENIKRHSTRNYPQPQISSKTESDDNKSFKSRVSKKVNLEDSKNHTENNLVSNPENHDINAGTNAMEPPEMYEYLNPRCSETQINKRNSPNEYSTEQPYTASERRMTRSMFKQQDISSISRQETNRIKREFLDRELISSAKLLVEKLEKAKLKVIDKICNTFSRLHKCSKPVLLMSSWDKEIGTPPEEDPYLVLPIREGSIALRPNSPVPTIPIVSTQVRKNLMMISAIIRHICSKPK